MPRGVCAHFFCIFERFSGHFFVKFSQNKIVMGKKILVPCLDVIMIAFFSRNIQRKTIFLIPNQKKAIIITSKHGTRTFFSAVSVKRSIAKVVSGPLRILFRLHSKIYKSLSIFVFGLYRNYWLNKKFLNSFYLTKCEESEITGESRFAIIFLNHQQQINLKKTRRQAVMNMVNQSFFL